MLCYKSVNYVLLVIRYSLSSGDITSVESNQSGTRFAVSGFFNKDDIFILNSQTADTIKTVNFNSNNNDYTTSLLTRLKDVYYFVRTNNQFFKIRSLSEKAGKTSTKTYNDSSSYSANNIDIINNTIVTTGSSFVDDKVANIFAVKNAHDLSTIWKFIFKRKNKNSEVAVGAFALPDNATGIVANKFSDKFIDSPSSIILLKLNKNGKLVRF